MELFLHIEFPDGKTRTFNGKSFGYTPIESNATESDSETESVCGEVVFQTGMVGYTESMTDPSYHKQLLVLTYPLIGSYGVPSVDPKDEHGISKYFESDKIHIGGLIVDEYVHHPSHWNNKQTLHEWLKENRVTGISGIDTRELTILIRDYGTLKGIISTSSTPKFSNAIMPDMKQAVARVSTNTVRYLGNPKGSSKILVIDCGIKNNQLRLLLKNGDVQLIIVPHDYDFLSEEIEYDKLFISNGPGDPEDCEYITSKLRTIMERRPSMPIFGICFGHQLMSIAAGFKTYKLKYGNRAHNIPCTFEGTNRCFVTTQNHGFATDVSDYENTDWRPLCTNLNDGSNEGIYHISRPWYSVQYHPESKGGPEDTSFLFDMFLRDGLLNVHDSIRDWAMVNNLTSNDKKKYEKVIVLGSGGLKIGQSGEFDYSGSQAIKAYKEEGLSIVLVNPNIATVQTSSDSVDKIYFLPVTPEFVEKIIHIEHPDCIALSFGGQTALNTGAELYQSGVLEKYNVKVLGTSVDSIMKTEDRQLFKNHIESLGLSASNGVTCTTMEDAYKSANDIGYPVLVRSAYALGGLGSGFANNDEELKPLLQLAFSGAKNPQVIIDKDCRGWKELEYEIVRDQYGNCISVCNMENFDPLGVHTGESIVVAPSQTLNDEEYNILRTAALKIVESIGIVGECNIQYAMDPHSNSYFVIEMNARLSRSSALASKATGYPLAYVAAKLSLGYSLSELNNSITEDTSACFEPSLDYCVVKIPRWDLEKFDMVTNKIDTAMKSVGEGMAISRTFEEALQKAIRMTGLNEFGLMPGAIECNDEILRNPTYKRILAVATGLYTSQYTIDEMYELSKIDRWFLCKIQNIINVYKSLEQKYSEITSHPELIRQAKVNGFSDKQIAYITRNIELNIRNVRCTHDIFPEVKKIDTVAAEFPCKSNYLYTTYKDACTWRKQDTSQDDTILVLGSGVYKIGSSVEFDWCSVNCIRELRNLGKNVIMVNCNPETVSTDYDEADRLYFDELSFETVMDIIHIENPHSVILSVGGQIPNNIAMDLELQSVNIIGTSPFSIDKAENRFKFSRMLETLEVDQPQWKELTTYDEAVRFCNSVEYPCLVRPSYVLSGAAMNVAYNDQDLERYLKDAQNVTVSTDHPVVISKFIEDAKEIEVDAVSDNGWVKLIAISEHVENAGVHSGDATLILPPQDLTDSTIKKIKKSVYKISQELNINGPFNIQFIAKDDHVKVIECNLRVSRSFPFVSKTLNKNFIKVATRIMLGMDYDSTMEDIGDRIGVKVPQFSFNRLKGADILLGVEMKSTGEVACFGTNKTEAYLKGLIGTGFNIPTRDKYVLLSIGSYEFKDEFIQSAKALCSLGYKLVGTHNTANFFKRKSIDIEEMVFDSSTHNNTIFEGVSTKKFGLIVNVSERNKMRSDEDELSNGYKLRRLAVESDVPIFTDIKNAKLLVSSLDWFYNKSNGDIPVNCNVDCFTSYKTVRIPGLIDVHVHVRDPGETYKEDWETCTKAAIGGGVTTIFAMPNTNPAVTDEDTLDLVEDIASSKAYCDYGLFVGANSKNGEVLHEVSHKTSALKMYLNNTHGPLLLESCMMYKDHLMNWPGDYGPVCVHAESKTLGALLFMAREYGTRIHVCHVSSAEEIGLVKMAKDAGMNVTCEVAPHHLFLTETSLDPKVSAVKPPLAQVSDTQSLWDNMAIIDCFATDHAPHTLGDKHDCSCPGFAGLETALPLLLTAVHDGRLTLDDIVLRYHTNPRKIFNIPDDVLEGSYVEIDLNEEWVIPAKMPFSKCGWTPFEGKKVYGQIKRVVIRNQPVFVDGNIIGKAGYGQNIRLGCNTYRRKMMSTMLPEPLPQTNVQTSSLKLHDIIDVSQFTRDSLKAVFDVANDLRRMDDTTHILNGKVLGLLFYENSTRTRCSFESAMLKLGGKAIHVPSQDSSVKKGESLEDTLRSLESFCDAIVLRHPESDSSERAANVLGCPLINGGAGSNSHPTQALLDAYTIRDEIGTLGGICVTFVGDLKYSRTIHSLIKLLAIRDNVRIKFVSPVPGFLEIPEDVLDFLGSKGIQYSKHTTVEEVIEITDVLYVTRIQMERLTQQESIQYATEDITQKYQITPSTIAKAKPPREMCILHPLPRVNEISSEIDTDHRAAYFRQMKNGLYIRMALLKMIMSK